MKRIQRVLLMAAYGVPYVFLALYGDARMGTMAFYGLMIAAFVLLSAAACRTENRWGIPVGNALSFAVSLVLNRLTGLNEMNGYFKPLTAASLTVLVTAAALLMQLLCLRMARRRQRT